MIKIAGSHQLSFAFPAELPIAFTYYSDLGRVLTYLPHIFLVQAYQYDQYRMLYSTVELGMYHIRIFCDLQSQLDEKERTLIISPLSKPTAVKPMTGVRSSTTQGFYSSRSLFHEANGETVIEFGMKLWADLPTPRGLRLMPSYVVNRIAHNITRWRIREIAEGFIERSIDAFPFWMEEMKQSEPPPWT
jgi:hypothetical protein